MAQQRPRLSSQGLPAAGRSAARQQPRWRLAALAALSLVLAAACTPHHELTAPAGFARFGDGDPNRWVTPDGVLVRARQVEEPSKASLAFWTEALQRDLERRGYRVAAPRSFQAPLGPATRLDATTNRGGEDWRLIVALYVIEDKLFAVEVVGPWARVQPHDAAIDKALAGFRPAGVGPR